MASQQHNVRTVKNNFLHYDMTSTLFRRKSAENVSRTSVAVRGKRHICVYRFIVYYFNERVVHFLPPALYIRDRVPSFYTTLYIFFIGPYGRNLLLSNIVMTVIIYADVVCICVP